MVLCNNFDIGVSLELYYLCPSKLYLFTGVFAGIFYRIFVVAKSSTKFLIFFLVILPYCTYGFIDNFKH